MSGSPAIVGKIGHWMRNPKRSLRRLWKRVRPMRRDYRAQYRMRLSDWMLYHQRHVAFERCHWMGVRTLKNPLDAWIMQEILVEVKPDRLIEIGSHQGGGVEDGFIDLFNPGDGIGMFADGPLEAVEEFLQSHPEFVVDRERERYLVSYNPKGYLKRVS